MNYKNSYLFPVTYFLVFVLSLLTNWYSFLVITLTVAVVFSFLFKLGKGIVLRELIALHGSILCLLMPLLGYTSYTVENYQARIFYFYMVVPEDVYFSYALPAMSGFIFAMCLPFASALYNDEGKVLITMLSRAKRIFTRFPTIGLTIVLIGLAASFASPLVPASLTFLTVLLYFSSYAGIVYVYFSENLPYRRLILFIFVVFIGGKALGGMFTEVAYMGLTLFSFLYLGKKTSLIKKAIVFIAGVCFFILLQSVKKTYREMVWDQEYGGSKAILMKDLLLENAYNFGSLFETNKFLHIYTRFNQGTNVSRVMKYIPRTRDFDNGSKLMESVAASFVPRILWPDKPQSGGRENMKYYTGLTIRGWSTNVGLLGEAYGSFGVFGGVLFMIILGFFVRWAYKLVFSFSVDFPLLLFWMPVLFYQVTSSMETDTLTLLNSLTKGAIFVWILIKLFPKWFGVEEKKSLPVFSA